MNFQKTEGKALAAHLDKVALNQVQRAAILEKAKPPPSPAKQLALLRAEQGTKRQGVVFAGMRIETFKCLSSLSGNVLPRRLWRP